MEHKKLDVWIKSMDLVEQIYGFTGKIPDNERFGLINQMRRAVVSIPSNIAEGAARKGDKEFIQFIHVALGSIAELETQYLITVRLNYVDNNKELEDLLLVVKKLLLGFRNYLVKKIK